MPGLRSRKIKQREKKKAHKPVKFESGRVGLEAKPPLFEFLFFFIFLTYDYGCILGSFSFPPNSYKHEFYGLRVVLQG